MEIYAGTVTVLMLLLAGWTASARKNSTESKPPTWERIVAALGESLNLANSRIGFLENKIEKMHLDHIECQKANAVLMNRVEMIESREPKGATC